MNEIYRKKVELLLRILPLITEEERFAIHGGTAINLFVKDLPRLSVDIDITYIPLGEDREESIRQINAALTRISQRIQKLFQDIRVILRSDICKLICESKGCQVKIEVNKTKRGIVGGEVKLYSLCEKAASLFGVEVDARIVPITQLYGGKIAAALSRQHPRDIFDIMLMHIPLSEVKEGLIYSFLGSDRPLYESFAPNLIDQREAMENQFIGMSEISFDYELFSTLRDSLIVNVRNLMNERDKNFLISFEEGTLDWQNSPYSHFQNYPAVKWKWKNLERLKINNPNKLIACAGKLREILGF